MVYCINVSDFRGVPETIYCTYDDDNDYYDVLKKAQESLVAQGFLGSLSHQIFSQRVFSDFDYSKIVGIIQSYFNPKCFDGFPTK